MDFKKMGFLFMLNFNCYAQCELINPFQIRQRIGGFSLPPKVVDLGLENQPQIVLYDSLVNSKKKLTGLLLVCNFGLVDICNVENTLDVKCRSGKYFDLFLIKKIRNGYIIKKRIRNFGKLNVKMDFSLIRNENCFVIKNDNNFYLFKNLVFRQN